MSQLPQDAPDFTPEWLTNALGREVTGVDVLLRNLATNLHLKLGLTYAEPGSGPATAFVKLPPLDAMHRAALGASGMGMRETSFFAKVAPTVELRVPTTYVAEHDDADGSFVLVLEDLAAKGCRFSDASWGVTGDQAAGALEDLARFHVAFEDTARRDAQASWAAQPRATGSEWVLQTLKHVITEFAHILSADYVAIGELYLAHHDALEAMWDAGPRTLAHGDLHVGNVFLDGERVGFVDWGLSVVSGPMRDVSYFMTMSVEPEDRRARQEELLRHYLDVRRSLGGAGITFDEAWQAHRVNAAYTVIASFLGLVPPYATEETKPLSDNLRNRSTLALEDLDVVDAVRAALKQ